MGIWDIFMLRPPGRIYLGFGALEKLNDNMVLSSLWLHNKMEFYSTKISPAVILIESSQGESLGLTGMQNLASFIYILSPIYFLENVQ